MHLLLSSLLFIFANISLTSWTTGNETIYGRQSETDPSNTNSIGVKDGYYMGNSFMKQVYVHAKENQLIADFVFFDKAPRQWAIDTLTFQPQSSEWHGTFSRLVRKGKRWQLINQKSPFGSKIKLEASETSFQQNHRAYRNEQLRKQHYEKFMKDHELNLESVQLYKNKSTAYNLEKQAAELSVPAFREVFERFMGELP